LAIQVLFGWTSSSAEFTSALDSCDLALAQTSVPK
jgi:hypothetical protein